MLWLLDTGILLRLFNRLDPDHLPVLEALKRLRSLGRKAVISVQNAAELWNVMTRPTTARGGYGLSVAVTERRLQHLERRFTVLCESMATYAEWKRLVVHYGVTGRSVHDTRLVAQMFVSQVPAILTLNPNDFQRYQSITVMTPMELLAAGKVP
jgi:predicted nucleic acid-binding protein